MTHVLPWKCFDWRHWEEWVWTDGCPSLGSDWRRVPGMQFIIAIHILWLRMSYIMLLTQRGCMWRMLQLITGSITLTASLQYFTFLVYSSDHYMHTLWSFICLLHVVLTKTNRGQSKVTALCVEWLTKCCLFSSPMCPMITVKTMELWEWICLTPQIY